MQQGEPDRNAAVSERANTETPPSSPLSIELAGNQRLHVVTARGQSELTLVAADGRLQLRMIVTRDGPVLHIEGAGLKVQSSGDLALEAEHLALIGRSAVTLHSEGSVLIHAEQDLHSRGRIQNISANLGNVNIKANDDVTLNGERVLVNCDNV